MKLLPLPILLSIGCGDPSTPADDSAATVVAPTWHQDVRPILESHCLSCHSDSEGLSGLPLDTFARAGGLAEVIAAAVEARTMPPWLATDDCNTYQDDISLSEADRQTILDWAAGGAPEGDPATPAPEGQPLVPPELDRVDLTLEMPVDYVPTERPDDYRCFLLEWPYEEQVYVSGFDFEPGNPRTVHHVIPFIIAPSDAAAYRALDAEDEDPGYACYGGPGGDITTLIETRWLGAWAPGVGAGTLPEGAGIRVEPGSLIALQLHYYVTEAEPAADRSKVHLQLETERSLGTAVQPWTDVAWLFGDGMSIPANTDAVTHTFEYEVEPGDSFTFNSAQLHMHTLGRSGSLKVQHADGTETCLLDIDRWDFNWQRAYRLVEPVPVVPGDVVELSCTWDNPTDEDVAWGDGTTDEMCLGVTLLTW